MPHTPDHRRPTRKGAPRKRSSDAPAPPPAEDEGLLDRFLGFLGQEVPFHKLPGIVPSGERDILDRNIPGWEAAKHFVTGADPETGLIGTEDVAAFAAGAAGPRAIAAGGKLLARTAAAGARRLAGSRAPAVPGVSAADLEARWLASRIGRFDPKALGPGSAPRTAQGPVSGPSATGPIRGHPGAGGPRAIGPEARALGPGPRALGPGARALGPGPRGHPGARGPVSDPKALGPGSAPRTAQGPVSGPSATGPIRGHPGAGGPRAIGTRSGPAPDANPFPQVSGVGRFAARDIATRKNLAAVGVVGGSGVAFADHFGLIPEGERPDLGDAIGGDLPAADSPVDPLEDFLSGFDTDAAGAAGGEPGAVATAAAGAAAGGGPVDLEGLYGDHAPAVNELLALENEHWDEVIALGRGQYDEVVARNIEGFENAKTDRQRAHFQARLLDAERQYQSGLVQVAQRRHIGLMNVRQYGVQLSDREQAQAADAQQQAFENEQAQQESNFASFQQSVELHGPALSAAAGQAMSQELTAALAPETVATLGPAALAVQEASNVALTGDTEGAMAVIGAEVQRLRAAATPETDLAVATLNQLLTAALQQSQAVQQGGLDFLMERAGVG